ncbi:MAG: cytochrome c [Acidobacteriota bacterium]
MSNRFFSLSHRTGVGLLAAFVALPAVASNGATMDRPTFVDDIAPLLHENCSSCHQPDEIGPMALRSYDEVRPWAKSIAKAVKNRDMPPWDADPGFGPFTNDISLSEEQIDTVVRWVDAGAPRGDGDEPAWQPPETAGEWQLGEPDWVYEFDSYDVAADGPDQFKVVPIPTGFEEDRWIKAVEVLPGDPSVVHHFILWRADESNSNQDAWLAGWAAGAPPGVFPEKTARLLPKGRNLLGDFHYHPTGNAASDKTRIGLHFADPEEIDKEFVNLWILNASFKIPAGDPNYQAKASYVFPQDVVVRSLAPHMHYRGKDMKYTAYYPNGTVEELLSVSRYDFNWQGGYDFEEPRHMPAGTKVEVVAHWDNSPDNPHNPDPTVDVTWGVESEDEMLIGFLDYTVVEGVSPKPVSLVLGKLAELSEEFPGEVWRFDAVRTPGGEPEPMAVHLPKDGSAGGWYVQMGTLVLPAPIQEVVWEGNTVTAKAMIPGQTMEIEGQLQDDGFLDLSMGGGTMKGSPAELEAKRQIPQG